MTDASLLHGDYNNCGIVLKLLFAVLAYGLHETALDFLG